VENRASARETVSAQAQLPTPELEYNQAQGWQHHAVYTNMHAIYYVSQMFSKITHKVLPSERDIQEQRQACTQVRDQPQNRWGAQAQGSLHLEAWCCDCVYTHTGTQNNT